MSAVPCGEMNRPPTKSGKLCRGLFFSPMDFISFMSPLYHMQNENAIFTDKKVFVKVLAEIRVKSVHKVVAKR